MSVSIAAGATLFTRMFVSASSLPSALVNAITPAFAAEYADSFGEKDQRNGQVTVIDLRAPESTPKFRTISLEGVKSLRIDGVEYDLDAMFGPLVVARS